MSEVTVSILIHRAPAEVLAVFSDEAKAPRWNTMIDEMKLVRGEPCQVGAVYMQKALFMGRQFEQLLRQTESTPHKRVLKTEKPFPQEYTFTFEPVPEGTLTAVTIRSEPEGFFKLAAPLIEATVRRGWQVSLERLKAMAEAPVLTTV